MGESSIEWTDATWNPVIGCARVSPGCENCYAERMAFRLEAMGQQRYVGLTRKTDRGRIQWTGTARFVPEVLGAPLKWRKPKHIFVNSMSDLFHHDVTNEQIAAVFGVMAACPQHTFQILTKRPERMAEWFKWIGALRGPSTIAACDPVMGIQIQAYRAVPALAGPRRWPKTIGWPLPNVWLGVSCEDQQRADERIPLLLRVPAAVRFLSCEPLLSGIDLRRYLHEDGGSGFSGSSGVGVVLDSRGRRDLETRRVSGRRRSDGEDDRSEESREELVGRGGISASDVPARDGAVARGRASHRLDLLQQDADPGCDGDQPHRREQGEPPPQQSGACDAGGERASRDSHSRATPEGTRRGVECASESHGGAGHGDPRALGSESDGSARVGGAFRTHAERGLSHRHAEELEARGLIWLIVGGESGPGARPCDVEWIRSIVRQCKEAGVACFVKQLGARYEDPINGVGGAQCKPDPTVVGITRLKNRKGGDLFEWPDDLRVREMPEVTRG